MIRAAKNNRFNTRVLAFNRKSIPRVSIRTATTVPTTTNDILNDFQAFSKTLPYQLPHLVPNNGTYFFDSPKENPPADDKPVKEKSIKKEKKEKEKKKEEKDVDDKKIEDKKNDIEDFESKTSINPNPASASTSVGAGAGAGGVPGNENGNNNEGDEGLEDNNGSDNDAKRELYTLENGLYQPLLAIPMRDRVPLPKTNKAIIVRDPNVIKCLKESINRKAPYVVLFHVKDSTVENADTDVIPNKEFVHDVGTVCNVTKLNEVEVVLYCQHRVKLVDLGSTIDGNDESMKQDLLNSSTSFMKDFKVSYGITKKLEDESFEEDSIVIKELVAQIVELLGKFHLLNFNITSSNATAMFRDPPLLADYVASVVNATPKQIQDVIETTNVKERLELVLPLLENEVNINNIKNDALKNMRNRNEKTYAQSLIKEYTKELLKAAGVADNNKSSKFDERLKKLKLTEEAMEAYTTEKAKLGTQSDVEQNVIEKYLDWLTRIPFGVYSKDSFDVKKASKILDRDHYGLKDVKDRILEFISVGKVSGSVGGKILCLAGPPGTGKTSIAKSIAEALNRKYVRVAVGGVQDVHDIRGHKRTYVGSSPGRIISSLAHAGTSNPLFLVDEIDKLDTSHHGGAARALLEVLDPEQNSTFVDTFIEVQVDLSKVLFVCTANYLGSIPEPLRDRMEIIEVNGYIKNEKIEIAKRHLIPAAAKEVGLEEGRVIIQDEAISRLIDKYCRESGLREVKRQINKIFSKAVRQMVEKLEESEVTKEESTEGGKAVANDPEVLQTATEGKAVEEKTEVKTETKTEKESEEVQKLSLPDDLKIEVTPENLKDFVGPEIYLKDRLYETLNPGVATGLAYTKSGDGDALYIESILVDSLASNLGNSGMHLTGSLKDVMKESASIAYSVAKQFMVRNFPDNKFFEVANVHIHCPGGSVPKDGPSAGIAFTSSLLSLALNRALPNDTAMTGEITLTGRVLPIGGLREKSLGAKRAGYTKIIFPKDCEYQLDEIPDEVKEGLTFIPVEWYSEVFDQLFKDFTKEEGNTVWKEEFAKLEETKKNNRSKE
ncbi:PIM1 Lon protease [Candida maltosa Xu316]